MKLYLWPNLQALRGHTSGMAFAVASSKDRAVDCVMERFTGYVAQTTRLLREELINTEPRVIEGEFGMCSWGSD